MTESKRAHIIYILDESSSMEPVKDGVISGFNEGLKTYRKEMSEFRPKLTVVKFSYDTTILNLRKSLNTIQKLTPETYSPNGGTALIDAIGVTLEVVKPSFYEKTTVFVFSDGGENASRRYEKSEVGTKIKYLTEVFGYTFSYVGAMENFDLVSQFGFSKNNTYSYDHRTTLGNQRAFVGAAMAASVSYTTNTNDINISNISAIRA